MGDAALARRRNERSMPLGLLDELAMMLLDFLGSQGASIELHLVQQALKMRGVGDFETAEAKVK